jgi:hypothetical protein
MTVAGPVRMASEAGHVPAQACRGRIRGVLRQGGQHRRTGQGEGGRVSGVPGEQAEGGGTRPASGTDVAAPRSLCWDSPTSASAPSSPALLPLLTC